MSDRDDMAAGVQCTAARHSEGAAAGASAPARARCSASTLPTLPAAPSPAMILLLGPTLAAAAAAAAELGPSSCPPHAYSLVPLDKTTGAPEGQHAACLDGSTPAYHFRPGTGADTRKVLVYLQGGGWCESSGQCYNRSVGAGGQSGDLGSSKLRVGDEGPGRCESEGTT